MKYNPLTKDLFTNNGVFIKKLYCPLNKQWDDLDLSSDNINRSCKTCEKMIFDTADVDDYELLALVLQDPHACLKIDLNQLNLTITYD